MICIEVTTSVCDVLLLTCITFAVFLINTQCLSFDIIPVFMT